MTRSVRIAARALRPILCTSLLLAAPMSLDAQAKTTPVLSTPTQYAATGRIRTLDGRTVSTRFADSLARSLFAEFNVTGGQIAVVNDGQLVWSAAYGARQRDPELPFDRQTITWAASITKSVFSTWVMQQVERGRFDLDAPIATLLPKPLDQYEPYKDRAGDIVKDPRWAKVTPRVLLSHSSSLLNFSFLEPDGKLRLHAEPGTQFQYSGEGINLVQFVLEQRLGKSMAELMDADLLQPLGMSRTIMAFRAGFDANIADRFGVNGQFLNKTRRNPPRGAGSMTANAEDIARFAIALMDGKVLKPATRAAMFSPVIPLRMQHQFPFTADEPKSAEAEASGLAYGVGWGLLTHTKFGPAFFKEGHGDGAQTFVICFERRRDCMVILTNSDNGEFTFRPLHEAIFGNTVSPWEWHGYTPEYITRARGM